MANYTLLRQGDKLPSVGVLQKLLNRGGAGPRADGDFGSRTKTAVQNFQRPRGLNPDGAVGQASWPRLSAGANLQIVDCIDIFDPSLSQPEERDIRRAGGNPIVLGGMSNGVAASWVPLGQTLQAPVVAGRLRGRLHEPGRTARSPAIH